MVEKIYFGKSNTEILDGLSDASSVLEMLTAFIASSDDLALFEHNDLNRSMDGLCVVLDSAQHAIETAYAELLNEKPENQSAPSPQKKPVSKRDLKVIKEGLDKITEQVAGSETGNETYPKLPDLSAREAAIAETYRKGYPPEEIASAVNLKRATVERIIGQLKDAGSIPPEPDNLSHAVNA